MRQTYVVYVCKLCGNVVEILADGGGTLVCCGEQMQRQTENTVDAAKEKHVPVVTINGSTATVKVGSVAHPMEAAHYIMWIDLRQGDKSQRVMLKPGQPAEATFTIEEGVPVVVREYCNQHGLWKA